MPTFQLTRARFIRAVVAALIIMTAIGWFFTGYFVDVASRTVKTNVDDANLIISLHLINELKRIENAAVAVAGSPLTLPLLEARAVANYDKANNILDRYHKALGAAACYLIDSRGLTLTSSNRKAKDSFVGQNYSFRPYFQDALKGGHGRYFAFGTVSKKRGFYAAAPVKNKQGRIVGVVAIKKELEDIENKLSQYIWFLADRSGIIFLSSQPDARLKSLWPLTDEQKQRIALSKQYGPGPFEPVLQKAFKAGEEVAFKGKQYVTAQDSSSFEGISVILLWPTQQISMYRSFGIILTLLINLLTVSFLTVIYIFQRSNFRMKGLLEESQSQALAIAESEGQLRVQKDELESTMHKINAMSQAVNDALVMIDSQGRVLFWNQSAEKLFGYTAEEAMGMDFHGLAVPPEAREKAYAGLRQFAATGKGIVFGTTIEATAMNRTEQVFPVEVNLSPFQVGEEWFAVGTVRDITERKKADAMKVGKEVAEAAAARAEQARQEAEHAQEELKARVLEIERFNRLSLGREERIIELKRQVNELTVKTGGKPFYQEQELTGDIDDDLSQAESAEKDLAQVETSPHAMAEMLSVEMFKRLLEDFCDSVGIASAIIDLEGKILAAARWQRACTDFHRVNEKTCARCIESDTELAVNLSEGKPFSVYRCKNGLTDAASPIIVNGKHIANTFVGQFFTAPPDMEFFRRQAEECGLDEERYLEAISEVPIVAENKLESIMGFLVGVSQTVATMSVERDLARKAEVSIARRIEESRRERVAAMSLAEDANNARAELERYKDRLELLVQERTDELRSSEERSRLILTSVSEGIFGLDKEGITTFVNPAASAMLGYSAEELVGQAMHEKVHQAYPDGTSFPREKCPMYYSSQDGMARTVDNEVLWRKDGNAVQVEYSTTPIFKDDCVKGAVVSFRDITDRKAMEQKIIAEGQRLKNILDTAPVSIAFSTKGRIHFANPLFSATFGVKVGEASPQLYVNPEERDALVERLKRGEIVENFEIQMYNSQKQVRDMLVTYMPINYEGEDGILGWLTDITGRKRAEKELKEQMEDLERFSRLTINREEKMIQLKEEVNTILEQAGKEKKYKIVE